MTYLHCVKCLSVVLCTLSVFVQPAPLNAHGTGLHGEGAAGDGGDTSHQQRDVAPTVAEEVELLERVERDRLGVNPGSVMAARMSANPGQVGEWGSVQDWPVNGTFTSVMPDGRVLAFDSVNDLPTEQNQTHTFTRAMTWTPSNGAIERLDADTGWNLFCAGFATLPDGRTFIAGGNRDAALNGIEQTHTFNHFSNTWARGQKMDFSRWYPSVTPLANGEMLITGGGVTISEVREVDGQIRQLTGASASIWGNREYPWLQTAPNGRALFLGPAPQLGFVATSGTGSWQPSGVRDTQYRSYGSYAMYDVGRVLVAGGGLEGQGFSQRSARIINMNNSSAASTGDMIHRRRQHNLTVLADGSVLATGGFASNAGLVDLNNSVFAAELWNPATGQWTELAEEERARQYHSTATLLPDGRVLSAGGGICGICQQTGYMQRNAQVFSPPYLFKDDGSGALANRPQIDSLPSRVRYNQSITVNTAQAAGIAKVALVRTSSVTHSQNMEQRYLPLQFNVNVNSLSVRMPANANLAPPGHYMLFIIDNNGVPSIAPIIRISESTVDPAPPSNAANYALNGAASASTNSANAAFAIDGVTDGDLANGSVFRSSAQSQPWWQVDLGETRDIAQIALHRRTDCCGDRLSGFHVLVSNSPLPENLSDALATSGISEYYVESFNGGASEKRIDINRQGRYVRIQLAGNNRLELAEVKVLGESGTGGDDECGNPNVDPNTDGGVYIWKSCNGVWSLLLAGASGLGTVGVIGEIKSTPGVLNVTTVSTESSDTVNVNGDDRIVFNLRTANPWFDQFNFDVPGDDELCVRLDNVTRDQSVFVGPNRTPAPNSPFNPLTLRSCDIPVGDCGDPGVDPATDHGLFVWKNCGGPWTLQMTGKAGAGTQVGAGLIESSNGLTGVRAISLEDSDTLNDGNPNRVMFDLRTSNPWQDGFEFVAASNDSVCLSVSTISSDTGIFFGSDRQPVSSPFNPITGESCSISGDPGCGNPNIDPATDDGLFIWKECGGDWSMMATGPAGGATAAYAGDVTASTGFGVVTPASLESTDSVISDNSTNTISFDIRTSNPWSDRFDFSTGAGATLCVDVTAIATGVFAGPDRQRMTAPFNPVTLGSCN